MFVLLDIFLEQTGMKKPINLGQTSGLYQVIEIEKASECIYHLFKSEFNIVALSGKWEGA